MTSTFDTYLRDLAATPVDQHTEHTGRSSLEALLRSFAGKAATKGVHVQHEPKRHGDRGAPDFKVAASGQALGYVEVKKIGARLDEVLKSDQIKKYITLSGNILLTDYLEWIWLRDGKVNGRATLAYPTDLTARAIRVRPERAAEVAALISGFFSVAPQGIGRAVDLAKALAVRSRLLRDALTEELIRQDKAHRQGKLFGLLQAFRSQVFHDLTIRDFADAFAQMLAYGVFLARLNAGADQTVTLDNAPRFIPGSFALIRELVEFLDQLDQHDYDEMRWIVTELLSIVNGLDLDAIHEDLSFRQRKSISRSVRAKDAEEHRLFERDPFIYFYEDYLKEYDPAMRKGRGVYYTPPPVVNFIVRAVDDILKDSFGIADGLADHRRVTVLDFACGTGTFLLEVFQRVFENIGGADGGVADKVVREHLLKNVYGFEYLIAPYAIAHLKLSQYLKDQNHPLNPGERLQVYLTNTLEPIEPQANLLLPQLSAEAERAQEIKEQPILVILGNPPYSGHSKNKGAWITGQIGKYREGFPELAKPAQGKWLQDDYVKFLRFAQWKMEQVEEGVVGVITNHSWLDNPTFKGMRKSLLKTFDQIYVFDLHGNSKKKERAPDGGKDENVFDIEQGVAIAIFVKMKNSEKSDMHHGDMWGPRLGKYTALTEINLASAPWVNISPEAPDWIAKPMDSAAAVAYRKLWSIRDIFSPIGDPAPGIVTTHDEFAISFTGLEAREKVKALLATTTESEARRLFRLCSQDQWSYARAKQELPLVNLDDASVELLYRPFDNRWTIWNRNVAVHRRERVMQHMKAANIGLITSRLTKGEDFRHVQVTDKVNEVIVMSPITSNNGFTFPIYIYGGKFDKSENYSKLFRSFLDLSFNIHFSPEEIFGYIYAVLHAPHYRSRYNAFLRIDFPRIPFPERAEDFEALSRLGWALVEAHLLRPSLPRLKLGQYVGRGDDRVEAVRRSAADDTVWINGAQGFRPVPDDVWTFRIGGYQVLDKYLKSRKGRVLSLDEIRHVARVCDALAFTVAQMDRIDAAYRTAFPEQAGHAAVGAIVG